MPADYAHRLTERAVSAMEKRIRDIYREARDELEALSVELTFTALRNHLYDPNMTWPGLKPGDKLKVVNHGTEIFSGVILMVGQRHG